MAELERVLLPEQQSCQQSCQQRRFVLHGLGGIGKTQLAVNFASQHQRRFSAVFWLNGGNETDGDRLLDLLDGLPLAIAQAAAFLQATGTEIQKYTEFYEQKWQELMRLHDWDTAPLLDYPDRSIWTTWAISFDAIRKLNGAAANLLLLWAFLDSKDLWYGLFAAAYSAGASAATSLSEWIGDIASSELKFAQAIGLLRSYSLVEGVQELGGYATHPVVHRWAYHFQDEDSRLQLAQLALIVVGYAVPGSSSRDYFALGRRLLSHAQACSRWILINETQQNYNDKSGSIKIKLAKQQGMVLYAFASLGNLCLSRSKFDEAEKMYQQVLEGREKELGPEHPLTLQIINNLGFLYWVQDKLEEAEKMYQQAIEGYKKALGLEHISTLNTIGNLGNLYWEQDKLDEAEKMYQRTLEGYKRVLGAEFDRFIPALRTIWGLASLFEQQADYAQARIFYSKALIGYEKAVGPGHPRPQELRDKLRALDALIEN
ncbi:NB-ARC and TPR domain protein [Phlyctema vagabunda]|uniref:NB-ARC and TPR domain protein n=1 Tax=Phlyctema vagabunda TaxID=108571 RepID=A0ABR4PUS6_9HELO